jgi:hypothetical protein
VCANLAKEKNWVTIEASNKFAHGEKRHHSSETLANYSEPTVDPHTEHSTSQSHYNQL